MQNARVILLRWEMRLKQRSETAILIVETGKVNLIWTKRTSDQLHPDTHQVSYSIQSDQDQKVLDSTHGETSFEHH